MKRPGFLRFIPLWPVLLLGLFILLWNQRLEIAIWILDRTVISGDIEDFSIAPSRIDLDRSLIDSISFTYLVGEQQYQLKSSEIEIVYKLSGLQSVSIESVVLGRLAIEQLSPPSSDQTVSLAGFTLDQMLSDLNHLLALSLPVKMLSVKQLDLSLPIYNVFVRNGSAHIQDNGEHINARIEDNPRYLDLEMESGRLDISLGSTAVQEVEILNLGINTQEANRNLRMNAKFDTAAFGEWIAHYPPASAIGKSLQNIKAFTELKIDINPKDRGYLANISAISEQITAEAFQGSAISADLDFYLPDAIFDKPVNRIDFDARTQLKAEKFNFGDLKITDLSLSPQGFVEKNNGVLYAEFTPDSKVSATTVIFDDYTINDISITPAIVVKDEEIQVQKGLKAQVRQISWPGFTVKQTSLSAQNASSIAVDADRGWVHTDGQWTIQTEIDLGQNQVIGGEFNTTASYMDTVEVKAKIESNDPLISLNTPLPPVQAISFEVVRSGQLVEAAGTLKVDDAGVPLKFTMRHDINLGIGTGDLWNPSPIDATALPGIVSALELKLPDMLSISDGQLVVNLNAGWKQDSFSLNADFEADELSGTYQESLFEDLAIAGKLEILPVMRSDGNLMASIGSLEYGVKFEQVSSAFSVEPSQHGDLPQFFVDNLQGDLFGSSLYASDFTLDLNGPDSQFDLKIQNLNIAQVVATQGIEELEATGQVDGNLPISISSSGVSINDGVFWNHLGGGNIAYSITDEQAAALDNPLTDVVIAALRDFRYRVLTANVDYQPNGELKMSFKLKGISPNLDANRPVHLNINTEENVLSLLKSLSYSEGVNQAIDKQIQEKFE
ncbi:MAG: YdbH domain-containing protein [Arenicellales bacterium]